MNAEKVNPICKIELGGKERKLKWSNRSALLIEEAKGVDYLSQVAANPKSTSVFFTLAWACLATFDSSLDGDGDPKLQRKAILEVASWAEEPGKMAELMTCVSNAINSGKAELEGVSAEKKKAKA